MHRLVMVVAAASACAVLAGPAVAQAGGANARFRLSSPQVHEGGMISDEQVFNSFGCSGENVSPALRWSGAPSGTKSFAITVYDPDAPTGSGWWHWLVFNIPASTTELPAGAGDPSKQLAPAGSVQSRTDFGQPGYGGPCPPPGDKPHHYIFTVYAVDEDKLQYAKDHNVSAAVVGFELHFHSKDKASLTATYGR